MIIALGSEYKEFAANTGALNRFVPKQFSHLNLESAAFFSFMRGSKMHLSHSTNIQCTQQCSNSYRHSLTQ